MRIGLFPYPKTLEPDPIADFLWFEKHSRYYYDEFSSYEESNFGVCL
jgi:hypothetical protein